MPACRYVHTECRCLQRPEVSDPLELELQAAVSYYVGVGNKTCGVFGKSSQSSQLLSYLSTSFLETRSSHCLSLAGLELSA